MRKDEWSKPPPGHIASDTAVASLTSSPPELMSSTVVLTSEVLVPLSIRKLCLKFHPNRLPNALIISYPLLEAKQLPLFHLLHASAS